MAARKPAGHSSEAHIHVHHHHHGAAPKVESAVKRRTDEKAGGRKANETIRRERKEGKKV